MTRFLCQKEFNSLESLEKEALNNDALQAELKRVLAKGKAVKQIRRVDGLLHRAKQASENILMGNKILPDIFEE